MEKQPVYARPGSWADLTKAQRLQWAREFARAVKKAAKEAEEAKEDDRGH